MTNANRGRDRRKNGRSHDPYPSAQSPAEDLSGDPGRYSDEYSGYADDFSGYGSDDSAGYSDPYTDASYADYADEASVGYNSFSYDRSGLYADGTEEDFSEPYPYDDAYGYDDAYPDACTDDGSGYPDGYADDCGALPPLSDASTRRRALRRSMPLFAALGLITVFAWILPLRPTHSDKEGRDLSSFPEFSVSALFDGDWFDGISLWFSDTFPARDEWVNAQSNFTSRFGDRTISVSGGLSLTGSEGIESPGEEPAEEAVPMEETASEDSTASPDEPVEPAAVVPEATPEPTPEPTPDPADGDSVQEGEVVRKKGALLTIGDTAYELYGLGIEAAHNYGKLLSKAADKLVGRARLFSVIAPNSGGIMLSYNTYDEFYKIRQDDAINAFYEEASENLIPVRVYDTLRAHNTEYLYFRTDHHWTALGAYYAYEEWCREAGFEPVPLSEYDEFVLDGFVGWFYRQENNPALAENPDTVIAYKPHANITASISEGGNRFSPIDLVTDYRANDASTKYLTFLKGGEQHYTKIINEDIDDDSACLILKDSYGNPFSIFVAQHYHTVLVASIRYYNNVETLLRRYNFDDIIVCTELVLAQQTEMQESIKKAFANIALPK